MAAWEWSGVQLVKLTGGLVGQRAVSDATRQFQAKLMLFYVLHEFLKSFQGERREAVQREWFQTVDDILHACMRDLRGNDDGRKRLLKVRAGSASTRLELY